MFEPPFIYFILLSKLFKRENLKLPVMIYINAKWNIKRLSADGDVFKGFVVAKEDH